MVVVAFDLGTKSKEILTFVVLRYLLLNIFIFPDGINCCAFNHCYLNNYNTASNGTTVVATVSTIKTIHAVITTTTLVANYFHSNTIWLSKTYLTL